MSLSLPGGAGFAHHSLCPPDLESVQRLVGERNQAQGHEMPAALQEVQRKKRPRQPNRWETFPIATDEKWTALLPAAADGGELRFYNSNEHAGSLRHSGPGGAQRGLRPWKQLSSPRSARPGVA